MWIATIDFMKAFDSVNHNSLKDALKTCGIEHEYISLLKRPHKNQKATVMTDEESDVFEIRRDQPGRPAIQLVVQHCAAGGLERRPYTLEIKKRNGHMLGRLRVRLSHIFSIC